MSFHDKIDTEVYQSFSKDFGVISYNMCNKGGDLAYIPKKDVEEIYDVSFLEEDILDSLIKKTVETGIDHLYEAVKDYPVIIDPNLLY